jgi:hypothetical protein
MKLNENQIRQLVIEELDRHYLEQLDEGVGDYLKTAYNYYGNLYRKAGKKGVGAAVKTFGKDFSDVGATDAMEWVAVIPAIGIPAGIAALGLRIAAEEYLEAAIGVLVMAAAQVGGGLAAKAAGAAGLPALLAGAGGASIITAATRILSRISSAFGSIPRIGPAVVEGVERISGQFLKETAQNIAEKKVEDKVLNVTKENQKIMKAYDKLKNKPEVKKIAASGVADKIASGKKAGAAAGALAGNRKDNINETTYSILEGDKSVKITKNLIRKIVKESLDKKEEIEKVDELDVSDLAKKSSKAAKSVSAVVPGADIAQRLFNMIKGDKEVKDQIKSNPEARTLLQKLANAIR